MDGFFAFSDEAGKYDQNRSVKFIKAHPFYVRATVLMENSDYIALEMFSRNIRDKYNIPYDVEIKWSELGRRYKGNPSEETKHISDDTIRHYIVEVINYACTTLSIKTVFTVFDNATPKRINKHSMIKMHIQDSMQRMFLEVKCKDVLVTYIIDDLGDDDNKIIKLVTHEILAKGDFVDYSKIKKSILVDYSHHCIGLQLADYCAGVFTSCLKRLKAEGNSFQYSFDIFRTTLYKAIRFEVRGVNLLETYGIGIIDVPNNLAKDKCISLAQKVNEWLLCDHGGPIISYP